MKIMNNKLLLGAAILAPFAFYATLFALILLEFLWWGWGIAIVFFTYTIR